MGKGSKWEYFKAIYQRYRKASGELKRRILDEFCLVCGYNRKYAISKLNGAMPESKPKDDPPLSSVIINEETWLVNAGGKFRQEA